MTRKSNKKTNFPNSVPPGKRPNPFGWLSLLILIVVLLVIFGKDQLQQEETVNQETFWYLLASGRVEEAKIDEKSVTLYLQGEKTRYRVEFPDTRAEVDKVQKLASLEFRGKTMDSEVFLAQIQEDSLIPRSANHLVSDNPNYPSMLLVEAYAANQGTQYIQITPVEALAKAFTVLNEQKIPIETFRVPAEKGTTFSGSNSMLGYIFFQSIVPLLLLALIIWFFLIRPMRSAGGGGGVLSFGRSRATLYTKENRTNVTFADVAGIEEAKEEVSEIIEFLKNPQRFTKLGGRIPRGVLLVGQPGCGKTLLAKAIAGEAEVPFFSISGSDFVEMFVGVGASRVRDLFKQAKDNSPCIIFLDEIDAVGRKRGTGLGGGHDEREQTLNAILVEMDGFSTDEGVIIIAATNRPDVLDPALLRPGRFDREIVIDLPDYKGREEILKVHARRIKLAENVNLSILARSTPTFSGADLAAVINEAAIIAVMKKKEAVDLDDLEEARDKIRFGRQKKSRVMVEEDRRITAYHEGGHALISVLLPDAEPLHKVTIIPRGMALGLTMQLPDRDRYTMLRRRVLADISVAYGGRLAEKLACDDISTGAQNDIQHATNLARRMVTEWGMSEDIGPINYSEHEGSIFLGQEFGTDKFHSEQTAREIDQEVRRILNDCYQVAEKLITSHRAELDRLAEALLKYETLTGAEVNALIKGKTVGQLRRDETPQTQSGATVEAEEKAKKTGTQASPKKAGEDLRGTEGFAPA